MKRREVYAGYRTPPPPARVVAGCLALAFVVGILFASAGARLGVSLAGVVITTFVLWAPRLSPGVPVRGGVFWHASFLFSLCTAERIYWAAPVGTVVFGACMIFFLLLGAVVHRPVGRGGAIR